jgi:hypothetical protein
MNKKITFSLLLGILVATSLPAQVKTFNLDISGGNFMGSLIPDYTRWYYFSFEKGDTIGTSEAVLENVGANQIGTEVINEAWKARTDWDIAFHAGDIRTNSGASGDGQAGAYQVPAIDAVDGTSLADIFDALTEAPDVVYAPDEILTGTFIFGMTAMPPLRTTQLSASATASGWAVIGMGGNTESPRVIVFKTAGGKYAKVHLKKFFDEEGTPGLIEFDYELIPAGAGMGTTAIASAGVTVYTVADALYVDATEKADIYVYTMTGALVRQAAVQPGRTSIPTAGWTKGIYIVRAISSAAEKTQKVVVK